MATCKAMISRKQAFIKRTFDFTLALLGLLVLWWLILLAWLLACLDMKSNGFFRQERVGLKGKRFTVVKIKTMRPLCSSEPATTVTASTDPRISALGRFFRKTKIDELPQLWNVLLGQMSFVGPRPDVPGYVDILEGEDRCILNLRPGITGPATLKYRKEEELLSFVEDPETYNREVIFPDKVKINLEYMRNWSFKRDLYYIWKTIVG
ncbi:sugar transferase [Kangiella sp. M94]